MPTIDTGVINPTNNSNAVLQNYPVLGEAFSKLLLERSPFYEVSKMVQQEMIPYARGANGSGALEQRYIDVHVGVEPYDTNIPVPKKATVGGWKTRINPPFYMTNEVSLTDQDVMMGTGAGQIPHMLEATVMACVMSDIAMFIKGLTEPVPVVNDETGELRYWCLGNNSYVPLDFTKLTPKVIDIDWANLNYEDLMNMPIETTRPYFLTKEKVDEAIVRLQSSGVALDSNSVVLLCSYAQRQALRSDPELKSKDYNDMNVFTWGEVTWPAPVHQVATTVSASMLASDLNNIGTGKCPRGWGGGTDAGAAVEHAYLVDLRFMKRVTREFFQNDGQNINGWQEFPEIWRRGDGFQAMRTAFRISQQFFRVQSEAVVVIECLKRQRSPLNMPRFEKLPYNPANDPTKQIASTSNIFNPYGKKSVAPALNFLSNAAQKAAAKTLGKKSEDEYAKEVANLNNEINDLRKMMEELKVANGVSVTAPIVPNIVTESVSTPKQFSEPKKEG